MSNLKFTPAEQNAVINNARHRLNGELKTEAAEMRQHINNEISRRKTTKFLTGAACAFSALLVLNAILLPTQETPTDRLNTQASMGLSILGMAAFGVLAAGYRFAQFISKEQKEANAALINIANEKVHHLDLIDNYNFDSMVKVPVLPEELGIRGGHGITANMELALAIHDVQYAKSRTA